MIYIFFVFHCIYCINLISIINNSYILNIIDHFHSIMLIFKYICVIFCIKSIILLCMYNTNIDKKKITCCILDVLKSIQIKQHIFESNQIFFQNSHPNQIKPHLISILNGIIFYLKSISNRKTT